ncbi:MAG: DUF1816 domain-containing protein [Oculatellaceae cyanobacterium Prado106]|nr:DUF1816 domain-containing protein [Oculatellaceae cyanobacterium Prado106]
MPNFFQSLTQIFRPKKPGSTSLDWWVEIKTAQPICIYYFGPFYHRHEAIARRRCSRYSNCYHTRPAAAPDYL